MKTADQTQVLAILQRSLDIPSRIRAHHCQLLKQESTTALRHRWPENVPAKMTDLQRKRFQKASPPRSCVVFIAVGCCTDSKSKEIRISGGGIRTKSTLVQVFPELPNFLLTLPGRGWPNMPTNQASAALEPQRLSPANLFEDVCNLYSPQRIQNDQTATNGSGPPTSGCNCYGLGAPT